MQTRDLKTIAELGGALWADPGRSIPAVVETLSAITLQDLTEERALERAGMALLDRALQQGMAVNSQANLEVAGTLDRPFWRMYPSDRFLLAGLHLGRWSYARAARTMRTTSERIETLAWRARTRLATDLRLVPLGGSIHGVRCPEYDPERPWTQRFLDEEIATSRERFFLQQHLMACAHCRQSLNRCRDLYYAVEKQLPKLDGDESLLRALQGVCKTGDYIRGKSGSLVLRSLIAFLRKKDVQFTLLALTLGILWFLLRRA